MFAGVAVDRLVRASVDCEIGLAIAFYVVADDGAAVIDRRFEDAGENSAIAQLDGPGLPNVQRQNAGGGLLKKGSRGREHFTIVSTK